MEIIFVRHGETLWNVEGRLQGQVNEAKLTEKGRMQAEEISYKLQDVDFDVIFSSPLDRTIETANIINKLKRNDIVLVDDLIERGYGELEGEYAKNGKYDIKQIWDIDNIYKMYGVEQLDLFIKRVHKFIDKIMKEDKYNRILLVSHSGVEIAMKIYFHGMPKDKNLLKLGIGNCEIMRFEKNEKYKSY